MRQSSLVGSTPCCNRYEYNCFLLYWALSGLWRKGGGGAGKLEVKTEDDDDNDPSRSCLEPHGEKRINANGKKPAHREKDSDAALFGSLLPLTGLVLNGGAKL